MDRSNDSAGADEAAHLVKMINQIAANVASQDGDDAAAARVTDHITRFWARPMKQSIIAVAQRKENELTAVARLAAARLDRNLSPDRTGGGLSEGKND